MAVNRYYSNTAVATTLSAGINNSVTSMQVGSVSGFPVSFPYTLVIDKGQATEELVKVTAAVGTTLTIVRGQDGTTAASHSSGAAVEHVVSAQDFREPQEHMDSLAAHGATGAVVGTTNTQALTNKTISLGSNTVSGTKAQFDAALTDADFATLAGTETLTNKTLTSPTINTPTVTGGTFSSPALTTPTGVARGTLGFAQVVANQAGIGTAVVDLTNLTVNVTVGSGRRIRISAFAQFNHDNTNIVALLIREGATTLATSQHNAAAGEYRAQTLSVVLTPSAGAHTYKLSAQTSTGSAGMLASATQPAYILVEDIGDA